MTTILPNLIYGLIDPCTLLIRYVGKTTRGLKRPQEHGYASCADTYCRRWIRSLERQGLTYIITILENENVEDDAKLAEAERWWIAYGYACGWPLTNLTDGGSLSEDVINEKRRRKEAARAFVLTEQRRDSLDELANCEKDERRKRRREHCFKFFEEYTGQSNVRIAAIRALKIDWSFVMEFHAEWLTLKETERCAFEKRVALERARKTREAHERGKCALTIDREARLAAAMAAKTQVVPDEQARTVKAREAYERGKRALEKDREARLERLAAEKALRRA